MTTKKSTKSLPSTVKKFMDVAVAVGEFVNIDPADVVFIEFAAISIHEVSSMPESFPVVVQIPQNAFDQTARIRQVFSMTGDMYRRPAIEYSVNGYKVVLTPPINDNQLEVVHGLTVPTAKSLYYTLANYLRLEPQEGEEMGLLPIIHLLSEYA